MGLCIWRHYKLTLDGNHQHSLKPSFVVLGLLAQCLLISGTKMFLLAYGLANDRPNKKAKI